MPSLICVEDACRLLCGFFRVSNGKLMVYRSGLPFDCVGSRVSNTFDEIDRAVCACVTHCTGAAGGRRQIAQVVIFRPMMNKRHARTIPDDCCKNIFRYHRIDRWPRIPTCLTRCDLPTRALQVAIAICLTLALRAATTHGGEPVAPQSAVGEHVGLRMLPAPPPTESISAGVPVRVPVNAPVSASQEITLVPLTLNDAIDWALQRNPDLAVKRRDLGIASAQIVTASYYPFNPTAQVDLQAVNDRDKTAPNRVKQVYGLTQEIELGGQGDFRRAQAQSGWSRSTWEVRQQEVALTVLVARRYQALIYAQRKLELGRAVYRLDELLITQTERLFQANQIPRGDVILTRLEAIDARRIDAANALAYRQAQHELRSALGVTAAVDFLPLEQLNQTDQTLTFQGLLEVASRCNAEIRGKQAALSEANAAYQLAIANQHANITAGPTTEIDENLTVFVGGQISVPLQIFNRKQGERQTAEAQRLKAAEDLSQTQAKVAIAIQAGLEIFGQRVKDALEIQRETPLVEQSLVDASRLFTAGQLDLLKLVELRRRGLGSRQQSLDATQEAVLAEIELTALTGCPLFNAIRIPDAARPVEPQR